MEMEQESIRAETVCFTGHRMMKDPLPHLRRCLLTAVESLAGEGYRYFEAGGARGFDALASEAVLQVKRSHPDIHLIFVLPFDEQFRVDSGWTEEEIAQYHRLKDSASKIIIIGTGYVRGIYCKRNRYMVDHASLCIAYQTRKAGGTGRTVDYAKNTGVPVINVASCFSNPVDGVILLLQKPQVYKPR